MTRWPSILRGGFLILTRNPRRIKPGRWSPGVDGGRGGDRGEETGALARPERIRAGIEGRGSPSPLPAEKGRAPRLIPGLSPPRHEIPWGGETLRTCAEAEPGARWEGRGGAGREGGGVPAQPRPALPGPGAVWRAGSDPGPAALYTASAWLAPPPRPSRCPLTCWRGRPRAR